MYRNKQLLTWLNILCDQGGIGDLIAWMPAVKYIYTQHPHVRIYLWVPDYFQEFAKSLLAGTSDRIIVSKWSDGAKHFKSGYPSKTFKGNSITNLGMHMTEHAFSLICNTQPTDPNHYNYLQPDLSKIDVSKFNLPEKYVVITTGYTAKVREFLPEYVNKVAKYCKSKGYDVVFLGKKETHSGLVHTIQGAFNNEIDYSAGVDLIDKTNLFEATKVCSKAQAVVGLDNGILHLAGCTDVNIVGGFTTVNPNHRMPYRDGIMGHKYYPVVPSTSLKCRFCQSNWQFTANHDFKECFYQDLQCVKDLTADLYITELDKIL